MNTEVKKIIVWFALNNTKIKIAQLKDTKNRNNSFQFRTSSDCFTQEFLILIFPELFQFRAFRLFRC